jgi:hypothetical protein
MLRWFESDRDLRVEDMPHQRDYAVWTKRLEAAGQLEGALDFIDSLVEKGSIHTSSWMPGESWVGTPLQPIFEKGTHRSFQQAGWCFGLMLMETLIKRPERWYCKKDPEVAGGTIYWKAQTSV